MAPEAHLDDGWFDYVHAGAISWARILALLPRLAWSGPPRNDPAIRYGRCRRLSLTSERPLFVHADGELLCTGQDGERSIDIELVPAALTVDVALSRAPAQARIE